jgi:protein tyrosine/serine phosphatase
VAGVHRDDIFADYMLSNDPERIAARAPMVAQVIETETGRKPTTAAIHAAIGVAPYFLEEALRAIAEAHGSTDAYLEAVLGVDARLREALEARLLD